MTSFLKQYTTEYVSKLLSWAPETNKAINLQTITDWCTSTPSCSTFRINDSLWCPNDIINYIRDELSKRYGLEYDELPEVSIHETISECIIINKINSKYLKLKPKQDEVIVDTFCGVSVLRGSHVYAPGVMGMLPQTSMGTKVSVYADLSMKCLRGFKRVYDEEGKLFVGNGIALMDRSNIFDGGKSEKGIAIFMTNPISGVVMFDFSKDMGILQNFPSIVCVRVLDPKPGDVILDMCAAPGNKTSHIAKLMNDEGLLIAIDRSNKVKQISINCENLGLKNCIRTFKGDSTHIVTECERPLTDGPPFSSNTFDKILLDAACSGSGQRPMLKNLIQTEAALKSFATVQKKFIQNAIPLLKPGGHLVYSTCSIFCEENECMVAWILNIFPEMELISSDPICGGPGFPECGLNNEQRYLVQRFGPGTSTNIDTIGFFIAKLRKK